MVVVTVRMGNLAGRCRCKLMGINWRVIWNMYIEIGFNMKPDASMFTPCLRVRSGCGERRDRGIFWGK